MNLSTRSDNGIYTFKYHCPLMGKTRRISTGKRIRREAENWVRDYMSQNKITSAKQYRHTLGASLWDTYRRVWSKQKSFQSTYHKISLIDRKIGSWLLDQLTYERLNIWFDDEVVRGRSPATVGRDINVISKTLHEARKLGWISIVPPMPSIPAPKHKTRWLTTAEEDTLITKCLEQGYRRYVDILADAIPFMCDTGARLGEFIKVQPEVINESPNGNYVTFKDTKNGTDRTVPLTRRAEDAISCVFKNEDWRARPKGPHLSQQFRIIADMCDMSDVTLHTMRHTCASRLVQGGMDIYKVQKWMGHSDIKVTQKYAHLAPSHLAGGVEILSR